MPAANASPFQIGQSFGCYYIDALLGVGGMGDVYCALDRKLRRKVAIKVVRRDDAEAGRALIHEARVVASLNHPAICRVHEVGCVGNRPFIVMEHVAGLPLSLVIPARHGLPLETVMHYALQMADAVAHAHSRGVVHRDLKSTNVMIGTNGDVKILDFGLAIREPAANAESETTRSESPSGAGTVPYMAPEILCGRRATPQSDIWALGVLLFEMLAGVRPFCGATRYELAAAILDRPPAPLPAQVPASLRRAVARCLEKQACQRFASAHQLAAALDNVPVRRPENCADTSV